MSTKHMMFVLALAVVGCDQGMAARPAKATITLTSVAFADDCGGAPPSAPAQAVAPAAARMAGPARPSDQAADDTGTPARRRCEQTAMQLAVTGVEGTELRIKSVEVFDEGGKSLGKLAASKPTRWVDAKAAYEPWDEKVAAGQTARVSYVLSQPTFVNRWDSHDRTYTVKVVAAVGGVDQPLQTTVMVVAQPAPVPT